MLCSHRITQLVEEAAGAKLRIITGQWVIPVYLYIFTCCRIVQCSLGCIQTHQYGLLYSRRKTTPPHFPSNCVTLFHDSVQNWTNFLFTKNCVISRYVEETDAGGKDIMWNVVQAANQQVPSVQSEHVKGLKERYTHWECVQHCSHK